MRCARCGSALLAEDERCPRCGAASAALISAPPLLPGPDGIPVQRFSPTLSGPPVGPEPYLGTEPHGELSGDRSGARRNPPGLHMVLPQHRLQPHQVARRTTRLMPFFVALVVAGLLAGLATGVLVGVGDLSLPSGLFPFTHAQPTISLVPTTTPTPACRIAPVDPVAVQALTHAQLTTGLRDEQGQDFRPVDDVSTFHAGKRAYITFQIASADAGSITVTYCTPAGDIPGVLEVPAGSSGRYAQFSIALGTDHVGEGVATLAWDGAVAASLPFTVEA